MTRPIPQYRSSGEKALEVIVWLANASPGIDLYHAVQASFFADKRHVSLYGRPIAGDNYDAAPYGPLPAVLYGLLRRDPIEMLALGGNGDLPFQVDERYRVTASREPNARKLSPSDVECLAHGLSRVVDKSFDAIADAIHDDPAYRNAMGGRIDARDFLPEDMPDREQKAQDLLESSPYVAF